MGEEDSEYPPLIIAFGTETIGTAALLFLGCMGCIKNFGTGPIIPAFTFGLSILAIVQTFHHFGPVHINPAVSIGFLIVGKMPWRHFLVYLVAQFVGGLLGYGSLTLVTPYLKNMCLLVNKEELGPIQCFANEALCSMYLMLLVLGAVDEQNTDLKDSIAIRIALGLTGIIFALEPFTGAGLNPARGLPPAVFHLNFENLWVYLVGPPVGMAFAAVIYRFIFDEGDKHSLHTWIRNRGKE